MIALLIAGFITLWLGMGTVAILVVFATEALAWRRGGGGMEDLIEATREEPDPDFADWERQWRHAPWR